MHASLLLAEEIVDERDGTLSLYRAAGARYCVQGNSQAFAIFLATEGGDPSEVHLELVVVDGDGAPVNEPQATTLQTPPGRSPVFHGALLMTAPLGRYDIELRLNGVRVSVCPVEVVAE